jgi:hypothetical protein
MCAWKKKIEIGYLNAHGYEPTQKRGQRKNGIKMLRLNRVWKC